MKYFHQLVATFNLLLVTAAATAAEPALEEFVGGYKINTDGSAVIYRLPLPDKVYQNVVRRDLGDLRVFNNDKQAIPHAVRRPELKTTQEIINVYPPLFPLRADVEQQTSDENLDVTITENGKIISIQYKDSANLPENTDVNSYIIDLSDIKQNINELEFELSGSEEGYLKSAYLEHSDDLNHWTMIVDNATLSELDYDNHVLKKNTINFPYQPKKYLRFTWRDGSDGLKINSVRAQLSSNEIITDRKRNVSTVTATRSKKDRLLYDFDTGGMFPVEQINIILPEENTLIEATLKSRENTKDKWQVHYIGLFYNLNMKGTRLEGGPVRIGTNTDRYWQLEVKTDDGMGQAMPRLEFSWEPNELYFLARGKGPYILAYGNASIDPPGKPIDALMRVLGNRQTANLLDEAVLGEGLVLMGEDARKPDRVIPWQRIMLWAILVIGVLVIGVMAWRLLRQLNQSG